MELMVHMSAIRMRRAGCGSSSPLVMTETALSLCLDVSKPPTVNRCDGSAKTETLRSGLIASTIRPKMIIVTGIVFELIKSVIFVI